MMRNGGRIDGLRHMAQLEADLGYWERLAR